MSWSRYVNEGWRFSLLDTHACSWNLRGLDWHGTVCRNVQNFCIIFREKKASAFSVLLLQTISGHGIGLAHWKTLLTEQFHNLGTECAQRDRPTRIVAQKTRSFVRHSRNVNSRSVYDTIRYDTRCYFNVRSKADISQLNLPHGTNN